MERSILRELCSWSRSLTKRSLWKRQEPRGFTHLCTSHNRGDSQRSNWSRPEWNAEDSSVPAKIACAKPYAGVHAGTPGSHSGINLCLFLPTDTGENGEARWELWHGASHDVDDHPVGLHFSSDSESKVKIERGAACPACVKDYKCINTHSWVQFD